MLGETCTVTLNLDDIPALDGALECLAQDIVSSLQADNALLLQSMDSGEYQPGDPRLQLLFDPQTSGGLLASVPVARAEDCLAALRSAGYRDACCIGFVDSAEAGPSTIKLR
jgi:selenide,water dikinase